MAEGPAQVVLAEAPAAQEGRCVAVGYAHGPAGLPEPGEQGFDGEVLAERPGAETLAPGLADVLAGGVVLMEQGVGPFVSFHVSLHHLAESRALPPAASAASAASACPAVGRVVAQGKLQYADHGCVAYRS